MELTALHKSLMDIAEHCGEDLAVHLVARAGGQRLYVPASEYLTDDHPLVVAVGLDAARRLAEHFAGERLEVPTSLAPSAARPRVLALAAAGKKIREIAAACGITEVRVYQLLAAERRATGRNPRTDPRQLDLLGAG